MNPSFHFYIYTLLKMQRYQNVNNDLVSAIQIVTVRENGCEIALDLSANVVVVVMVLCSSIEWNVLGRTQREIITSTTM